MLRITALAILLATTTPAAAGTVTCAGKVYKDITYATITDISGIQLVRMWIVEVHNNALAIRHTTPKWALTLNSEMLCEFEDVRLTIVDPVHLASQPENEDR
jgi:hypothetical protein